MSFCINLLVVGVLLGAHFALKNCRDLKKKKTNFNSTTMRKRKWWLKWFFYLLYFKFLCRDWLSFKIWSNECLKNVILLLIFFPFSLNENITLEDKTMALQMTRSNNQLCITFAVLFNYFINYFLTCYSQSIKF